MSDKPKGKKKAGAGVQIYSRVRKLMPWEPTKISVKILDGSTVQNKTDKKTAQYTFSHVFNMTKTNEDIYRVMGKPLVRKVLEGFNAVLIAYGQTGSGKTHTLIGKPEQDVMGVLPFMLQELYNAESVKKLSVSGVEAYGTHVSRIELFDLFLSTNLDKDWTKKKGQGGLEPKKCTSHDINKLEDCWGYINQMHDASHFAPTGKNPESSRGHAAFCVRIEQEDAANGNTIVSYLIVVDLAGSEGESAFTPEFVKKVDAPTLMARRLEAGCINTGLSQLQVVFNELKVKGKLSKSRGTGLRRILHAYINSNCMISVMFTLSPSFTNRVTTESTLKFAVQAGMVKVKPVKAKAQVNYKVLVEQLQVHVKDQQESIDQLNDTIEKLHDQNADLEFKVKQLSAKVEGLQKSVGKGVDGVDGVDGAAAFASAVADAKDVEAKANEEAEVEKKRRALQKLGFKRVESKMPSELQSNLDDFNEEDDDGYVDLDEEEQKTHVASHLCATKIDSEIKRIHTQRTLMGVDTNMLNASIRKSTTMSKLKMGALAEDGDDEKESSKVETPKPKFDLDLGDDNEADETPSFADIEERQQTIKETMIGKTNMFDVAQDEMENEEDADFMQFTVMDTGAMDQFELQDYCDQLESKLIEEKTLRFGLEKSQQVIINHLMDTNEALLQWFKVKKIL